MLAAQNKCEINRTFRTPFISPFSQFAHVRIGVRVFGIALVVITLLSLIGPQVNPALACPPTGGYVGQVFEQGIDLSEAEALARSAGLSVGRTQLDFPYAGGTLSLDALYIDLGVWPSGRPLRAYLVPGKSYSLVLSETSVSLEREWLRLAVAVLASAGILDPSIAVSEPKVSPNNVSPPQAVVEWARLELGMELEGLGILWRCGPISGAPSLTPAFAGRVAVVANEIDANISYPTLEAALKERGVEVELIPPDRALEALLEFPVVIFLGGHKALSTGPIVSPFMDLDVATELETGDIDHVILSFNVGGTLVIVLAGKDRWGTLAAVEEFVESGQIDRIASALACPTGVCVRILSSEGDCHIGPLESGGGIEVEVNGSYVYVTFVELGSTPCHSHALKTVSVQGRTIEIELELLEYPGFCVQCIGAIRTVLEIGPLDPGEWTIQVNNSTIRVVVPAQ